MGATSLNPSTMELEFGVMKGGELGFFGYLGGNFTSIFRTDVRLHK